MDVFIYTEGVRKVKGEEQVFLAPLAELEDFDTFEDALEALVDEAPQLLGTEFVCFTEQPTYITVDEPPATKYAFSRRDGNAAVVEAEEEPVEDQEDEPEEEVVPVVRKRPASKKPAAKKRPAAKRPGRRAATRTGSSRRTPFTGNPASAE